MTMNNIYKDVTTVLNYYRGSTTESRRTSKFT